MSNTTFTYNSHVIDTDQKTPHKNLKKIVTKHQTTLFQKPYREHNLRCFEKLQTIIHTSDSEQLILDSCCGTGMSTRLLAQKNPHAIVIGLDQSAHRLHKNSDISTPESCYFLQGNCEDIWRLCTNNNIHFDEHYLLYPNPYPKAAHIKRRWHGHPVFNCLPKLARSTTLRSNWQLYLQEFALAWEFVTDKRYAVNNIHIDKALTLFEKKYVGSGQAIFELVLKETLINLAKMR